MTSRHNSVDNLTPVKARANSGTRYQQGAKRARELEQHLRDKYGLPDNTTKHLRRTNSHSSLAQFSPATDAVMRPPTLPPPPTTAVTHSRTLLRRKSYEQEFGPKSLAPQPFTHLHQHHVTHHEPRDSKLRYLGRMSPEEQVDKYLKSVEKVNAEKEAKIRQRLKHRELSMHLESHNDYRTTFDPSKHMTNPRGKINMSM